jgi:hypothetical protein
MNLKKVSDFFKQRDNLRGGSGLEFPNASWRYGRTIRTWFRNTATSWNRTDWENQSSARYHHGT